MTRNGKRCPNMAEPGSRYCGIHADYVPRPRDEAERREAAATTAEAEVAPSDPPTRPARTPRSDAVDAPERSCVGCRRTRAAGTS